VKGVAMMQVRYMDVSSGVIFPSTFLTLECDEVVFSLDSTKINCWIGEDFTTLDIKYVDRITSK
jgi:hypothetical protein